MILDDIRDKTLEGLQSIKSQLDESATYNKAKESYDSLPAAVQRGLLVATGLIFTLIVLQFPYSFYATSSENLALFEENRDLVLDLYRTKRTSLLTPQSAIPLEPSELEGRARTAVTNARVQPEQIKGITFFDNSGPTASSFIPKNVTQSGVEVRLANLNLAQIVEIGHALTNLGSTTKITGLEVRPGTAAGNYFDAIFKVVSFNVPQTSNASAKTTGRRK